MAIFFILFIYWKTCANIKNKQCNQHTFYITLTTIFLIPALLPLVV